MIVCTPRFWMEAQGKDACGKEKGPARGNMSEALERADCCGAASETMTGCAG